MAEIKTPRGETYHVTFKKVFATDYGLKFMLMPSDDANVKVFKDEVPMFKTMLELNHLNVGCAIFIVREGVNYKYDLPLVPTDNEFYLDAIYGMIQQGQCV